MKNKIKEALKQKYSNLGLGDDVFEGVASSAETFIADESKISDFVVKAESMLKKYQSIGDKDRTAASESAKKVAELQALLDDANSKLGDKGGQAPQAKGSDNIAEIIAASIEAAIKPITEKLSSLEQVNTSKDAKNSAHESFFSNDYAKKYSGEAEDAWEMALEVYNATGSKMTAEELSAKAQSYFSKAVSRKGVDTSKPFAAEPTPDVNGTTDWSGERKRKQEQGKIAAD